MAEKSTFENELPKKSTVKWLRGLDENGNPVLIDISDHATVVGELIGRASEEKAGLVYPDMFAFIRSCNDANNAVTFGLYKLNPSTNNVPSNTVYGDVLLVMPWDPNTVHQVVYKVNRQELKRVKSGGVWGEWI